MFVTQIWERDFFLFDSSTVPDEKNDSLKTNSTRVGQFMALDQEHSSVDNTFCRKSVCQQSLVSIQRSAQKTYACEMENKAEKEEKNFSIV